MRSTHPMLETERLVLRGWRDEDADLCADMLSDAHVMRFYARPMEREAALESVARMRARLDENGYGRFVLNVKGDATFAGMMVLDDIRYAVPFEPTREVGWILPQRVWGNGYATEAAQALLDYARDVLKWTDIVAMTTVRNIPSQRVMQKLGMTHDPAENFRQPSMTGCEPEPFVLYRKRLL